MQEQAEKLQGAVRIFKLKEGDGRDLLLLAACRSFGI
jgi:hypothetical protein